VTRGDSDFDFSTHACAMMHRLNRKNFTKRREHRDQPLGLGDKYKLLLLLR
jgi:hypothetical protein